MNFLPWIIVVIVVLIIVGFYFYNKNKQAKIAADVQLAQIAANTPPPCVPFTKTQQDQEKRDGNAKCYKELLNPVPVLGKIRYYNCIKKVKENLTQIVNC